MNPELPPVAPDVVASAVEGLTSRLRKKLDATIASYAALPVVADGAVRRVRCGEDTEVALTPGASGSVTDADQVVCSCLLAPRCLHRAAVLGACPLADPEAEAETAGAGGRPEDSGTIAEATLDAAPILNSGASPTTALGAPSTTVPGDSRIADTRGSRTADPAASPTGVSSVSPITEPVTEAGEAVALTEAQRAAASELWR
ncbi:hypothetical protein ABZW95_24340, partial [Streptomyces sp. NPDC004579]